jgi:hypothetical protein
MMAECRPVELLEFTLRTMTPRVGYAKPLKLTISPTASHNASSIPSNLSSTPHVRGSDSPSENECPFLAQPTPSAEDRFLALTARS